MNYYIEGNPDKAEQIKAAFEKLGYDISWPGCCANPDVINIGVERNGAKYVVAETSEYIKDIILTHPDYKELELTVEPKFKVGDWVVFNNSHNSIYQISEIRNSYYMLTHTHGGSMPLSFSQGELLRPWTIEDAKDGDVLIDTVSGTRAVTILFRGINADGSINAYCGWNECTFRVTTNGAGYGTLSSTQYVPATEEQRDLLFAKMKEAGYEWDADKKELRKIQPHYDIANFKPFDKVLVRDSKYGNWNVNLFSYYIDDVDARIVARFHCINSTWIQCIPYEGNEHLLGNTDMPSEEYINWL